MSIIMISELSILSPCSESGGGYASIDDYACIHNRTDASPLLLFNNVPQHFPSIVLAILLERQLCNTVTPSMTISEPRLHLS